MQPEQVCRTTIVQDGKVARETIHNLDRLRENINAPPRESGGMCWLHFTSFDSPGYEAVCLGQTSEMPDAIADSVLTEPSRSACVQSDDHATVTLKYFTLDKDPEHGTVTLTPWWFFAILNFETNVLVTVGALDIYEQGLRRLGLDASLSPTLARAQSMDTNRQLRNFDAAEFLAYLSVVVIEFNSGVVEEIGDRMDEAEQDILDELPRMHIYAEGDLTMSVARDVHALKRQLFGIRRALFPCREALSTMLSTQTERLLLAGPQLQFRLAHDLAVSLIDNVETLRELGTNLVELYSAQLSLVMDKQMKILAMIDVIFLPLVFLAGVYGMNFKGDQMPELSSSHGYLIFWMVCLGFALLSLFWFYKKKWVDFKWIFGSVRFRASRKKRKPDYE